MDHKRIEQVVASIIKGRATVNKIMVKSLFSCGGTISEKQAKKYLKENK